MAYCDDLDSMFDMFSLLKDNQTCLSDGRY